MQLVTSWWHKLLVRTLPLSMLVHVPLKLCFICSGWCGLPTQNRKSYTQHSTVPDVETLNSSCQISYAEPWWPFRNFIHSMVILQEYCTTEFLRVSGVYWGLTAMDLMGQLHRMNKTEVLEFVKSCQHASGGFSPTLHHDPHLLYTLSAVQVR